MGLAAVRWFVRVWGINGRSVLVVEADIFAQLLADKGAQNTKNAFFIAF